MKIKINLLPPQRKKALTTKRLFKMIVDQELKVGLIFAMTILALWGVRTIVAQEQYALTETNMSARQNEAYTEVKKLHELFQETNIETKAIGNIYKKNMRWSEVLMLVAEARPEGVRVTEIETEDVLITITGIADSPPDIVSFSEALKNVQRKDNSCFEDIDVPDKFLASSQQSEFSLTMNVNEKICLRSKNE